ncbi:hypothetical protein [Amycolatopsis nigrescens]|uniref:hypothetical protein n=1 Tax=Amycolatopsis nigrescens TaxID=381445 RepID=UPI00037B1131|nr:hypothetical protein [Amycolatopsis nigrescens]
MDERELETLFRDAPGEPPPSAFTMDDISKASARAKLRRRNALVAGLSCLIVLAGGAGVVLNLGSGVGERSAANAPGQVMSNTESGPGEQPPPGPARPLTTDFPTPSPKQGGDGTGENGPRAESTYGCDKVDRELATALAGELPVTVLTEAAPGRICTETSRSASFGVQVPGHQGLISATVLPPGVRIKYAAQPPGSELQERATQHNATLVLLSVPSPGDTVAPFRDDLSRIADGLAARF